MKITIEVDCTPEEARRAMGLPDIGAVQDAYLARIVDMSDGSYRPELVDAMIKGWAPMGEAGLAVWRALADAAGRPAEPAR